jgi:tetratricopeptide (TPR) repeat protein
LVAARPTSIGFRNDLATVLNIVGHLKAREAELAQSRGDLVAAEALVARALVSHTRALSLRKAVANEHPENHHLQGALISQTGNVGGMYFARNEFPEAIRHYREATKLSEDLVREHPEIARYQEDATGLYENLARVYAATGTVRDTVDALRQSLIVREKMIDSFPAVPAYKISLQDSCSRTLTYMASGWTRLSLGGWRYEPPLLRRSVTDLTGFLTAFDLYSEIKEKQGGLVNPRGNSFQPESIQTDPGQQNPSNAFPAATAHLDAAGMAALQSLFDKTPQANRVELIETVANRAKSSNTKGRKTYRLAEISLRWWAGEKPVAVKLLESLAKESPDDKGLQRALELARASMKER